MKERKKGMNEMAKKKESTPGENLAKQIIEHYNPKSVADMQDALKDIFGPMLQGEMNNHLAYESNDHGIKTTDNRRNGYTNKRSKRVPVKWISKYLVTVIRALNHSLYRSGKRMYPRLKKRFWRCMRKE